MTLRARFKSVANPTCRNHRSFDIESRAPEDALVGLGGAFFDDFDGNPLGGQMEDLLVLWALWSHEPGAFFPLSQSNFESSSCPGTSPNSKVGRPKRGHRQAVRRSPEEIFGQNRRKWLESSQPMRQKNIQGLLRRFRCSLTSFDEVVVMLNWAL